MNSKTRLQFLAVLFLVIAWLVALPFSTAAHESATPGAESTEQVVPALRPAEGDWTLTLNTTAVASCLSQRRFVLPASRIFDPTSFSDTLTVIDDDSFQFRDDVFRRIEGTTRFSGAFTFPDTTAAQAIFNLTTTATMRGQMVANYRVDTTRCSETVQFEFRQHSLLGADPLSHRGRRAYTLRIALQPGDNNTQLGNGV